MKKILIGMLSVAGFVFSAQAQETRVLKEKGEHHQKRMMSADLNLTEAQKEQIKNNRESFKTQLAYLEKQETITVKEYKEKKASIYKEQKEKMANILTDDQKAKLSKSRTERKGKHGMHKGGDLEQMKSSLNLSDEQVSRLEASRETQKAAAKAIKENTQLSATEKHEKLKELKEKNKANLQEILTPEQLQKMKEMRKERPRK